MPRNRTCNKCATEYEHYGQKITFCKACIKYYHRQHHSNRTDERKKEKMSKQKVRALLIAANIKKIKSLHGCKDCGIKNWIVLEFDHVSNNKRFNICDAVRNGYSEKVILEEIAKCEVVCANCHRIRTYKRRIESSIPTTPPWVGKPLMLLIQRPPRFNR